MELELIMSDVAIRYLGDLIFIANFKIFSRGGGGGVGVWHSGTEGGAYARFQNLKIPLKH